MQQDKKLFWIKFAFDQVMPKIEKITKQKGLEFHGLPHTEQVILFGIEYALSEGINPTPVILACALHDCARTHDDYDETHGPNCVPIAKKFLYQNNFDLTEQEKEQIIHAVEYHTIGKNAPNKIAACLWDADRTRLSWMYGYAEKYFSTQKAKEIASLPPVQKQKEYEQEQINLIKKAKVNSHFYQAYFKQKNDENSLMQKLLTKLISKTNNPS